MACRCGVIDCIYYADHGDYPWCRPCEDHHRPPECEVNEQGEGIAFCGCTHTVLDGYNNRGELCPHSLAIYAD
jgi:hypothetical protein